jgi:hypothetical protein
MRLLDYECQTTFWQDFSIAEKFGKEAIIDTYKRSKKEWGKDKIYGTELSMVLNHKCWFHYEARNIEISQLYSELWAEYHDFVLDNWKSEDLAYYLKTTD